MDVTRDPSGSSGVPADASLYGKAMTFTCALLIIL